MADGTSTSADVAGVHAEHDRTTGSGIAFRTPKLAPRILAALGIAVVCFGVSFMVTRMPRFADQDFRIWWLAAKVILQGRNPYTTIVFQHEPAFVYPLPAALVAMPFAGMPVTVAGPLFVALSCGVLAFALTTISWRPLLVFMSGAMFLAVFAAQFTPLLLLGFLWPGAMWVGALKPNIALVMLAWCPAMKGLALMAIVGAIALISMPSWPMEWFKAALASTRHFAPVLGPGGPLMLLALIRWRRPEARLLTAMAVLPSSPLVYEALPLFMIARTRIERCVLAVGSSLGYLLMVGFTDAQWSSYLARGRWVVVWLCYLPALAIVLRRPNVQFGTFGGGSMEDSGALTAATRCLECGALVRDGEPSCSMCNTPPGIETPGKVLALGYTATTLAFLAVVYVTFMTNA